MVTSVFPMDRLGVRFPVTAYLFVAFWTFGAFLLQLAITNVTLDIFFLCIIGAGLQPEHTLCPALWAE